MNSSSSRENGDDAHSSVYRYGVLTLLMSSYVLNFADRQIMGILAPQIKAALHLSDAQLGALGGLAFALSYSALGVPLALLADRIGRVRVIAASIAVWSAFTVLTGLATDFALLFWCRIGVGTGEAGGIAPAHAIITSHFPPRQWARALAIYSLGIPIGSAAGLLLGAGLAVYVQWRGAFVVCGAIGLFLAPIILLVVREPHRRIIHTRDVSAPLQHKAAFRRPAFWLISVGAGISSMTTYSLVFWMPSFLERSYRLPGVSVSWLLGGVVLLAGSAGVLLGGRLADSLGSKNKKYYVLLPAIFYGLAAPAYAGAVLATSLRVSLALYVVPTVLTYATFGPTISAIQHNSPAAHRAGTSALFYFILNFIGIGAGALIVGTLSDALHLRFGVESLRYAIMLDQVFLVVGASLFWLAAFFLDRDWSDGSQ